jgi:hypothetical protein
VTTVAALAFTIAAAIVIGFQLALAAGAPWGAYAMGGTNPGVYPRRLRVAAVAQAVLIGLFAVIVLEHANLLEIPLLAGLPSLIWLVVVFSAVSLVLNLITRSTWERRLWAPVALVMLISSVLVAISPN